MKELRLLGIHDPESANAFLLAFIEDYNARFAVKPQHLDDAHRPVLHDERELGLILSLHRRRTLSKNLTCQFENREYQVQTRGQGYTLRNAYVTVCKSFNGQVTLLHRGRDLEYRMLQEGQTQAPIVDEKTVQQAVELALAEQTRRLKWKPPADHPWRRMPIRSSARCISMPKSKHPGRVEVPKQHPQDSDNDAGPRRILGLPWA